jgi:hypothetical protein
MIFKFMLGFSNGVASNRFIASTAAILLNIFLSAGIAIYSLAIICYLLYGPISFSYPVFGFKPISVDLHDLVKPIKLLVILSCLKAVFIYSAYGRRASSGKTVMAALLLAFPLCFFVFYAFDPRLGGDAGAYYAWLRSFMLDGDIDFANDLKLFYGDLSSYAVSAPNGLITVKYPIGVSIFEIPGFVLAFYAALITGHSLQGWSPLYFYSIGISNLLIFAVCVRLFYHALAKQYNPTVTIIALTLMLLATNALHYLMRDTGYAHLPGLAVSCLIVWLASIPECESRRKEYLAVLTTGILMGLLLIIRNTNLLLAPFFAHILRKRLSDPSKLLVVFLGVLPLVMLQLFATYSSRGTLTLDTYKGEGFTAGLDGVAGTLISPKHGLFIYHPWYIILLVVNIYGAVKEKSTRYLNIAVIMSFVFLWVANGLWYWWWFGASFGNRAFIETIVPLTMGAVAVASAPEVWTAVFRFRKAACAVAVFLVLLNMYTWYGFLKVRYDPCGEHSYSDVFLWALKERPKIVCDEEKMPR